MHVAGLMCVGCTWRVSTPSQHTGVQAMQLRTDTHTVNGIHYIARLYLPLNPPLPYSSSPPLPYSPLAPSPLQSHPPPVPNLELGHMELDGVEAEAAAAGVLVEREGLTWQQWADKVTWYLGYVERLFWPARIVSVSYARKNPTHASL